MDESVGVGLIVGLAIGVTTYLWNSVYFSKAQKYVLLAFIVFPPLQWTTAIILFIYNYQKFKSSKEYKVETAKNTAVSSLKELREKGILTETEYKEKVSIVESQRLENTREYKQLKNLFDSGILTKEEFENKVSTLGTVKTIEAGQETPPIYVEPSPLKPLSEKANSSHIYMYSILFFIILIGATVIISSFFKNEIKQDYNYPSEPTVNNLNYDNSYNYEEPINTKKFVYVEVKISCPQLNTFEYGGYFDANNNYVPTKVSCTTSWVDDYFTTAIVEIENYDIDEESKMIDRAEREVELKLYSTNLNYETSVRNKCRDHSTSQDLLVNKSKIIYSKVLTFNSYSEASINKRNNINQKKTTDTIK